MESTQVAAAAVARCLPPEDVLSKKDLGRGLMHGDPAANRAALVLVLRVLDRFAAERGAAVDVFGGCAGAISLHVLSVVMGPKGSSPSS